MNIIRVGREYAVACAQVDLLSRLHENFSALPSSFELNGMFVIPIVESATVSVPGGLDSAHAPPIPFHTIPARWEAPPAEITVNFLYTPDTYWLLRLYNISVYPSAGVDILLVNRNTRGGFYFPSALARSLTLTFSSDRLLSVSVGFVAPMGFVVGDGGAPPYAPSTSNAEFVRAFTCLFDDLYGMNPLSVVSLTLSVNNTIAPHHTMLAVPPATNLDMVAVRAARIWTFGIPTVNATVRVFAQPSALPSYRNGMAAAIQLTGYGLDFTTPLLEFAVSGVIQSVNTSVATQEGVFYQASIAGVGVDAATPPVVFP